jgi:hypothetical protein
MTNDFDELDLILGSQEDCRGPMVLDKAVKVVEEDPMQLDAEDPIGSFLKVQELAHLAKNLPKVPIHVHIPSVDEMLGDSGVTLVDDVPLVKHEEVEPEEMTLAKRDLSKASSGPGMVRLEKTTLENNEVWLTGYDHQGEEVFSKLFAEEA